MGPCVVESNMRNRLALALVRRRVHGRNFFFSLKQESDLRATGVDDADKISDRYPMNLASARK